MSVEASLKAHYAAVKARLAVDRRTLKLRAQLKSLARQPLPKL